jgi:hypothetical protein
MRASLCAGFRLARRRIAAGVSPCEILLSEDGQRVSNATQEHSRAVADGSRRLLAGPLQ